MKKKEVFCGGLFCHKTDRQVCGDCGQGVCSPCARTIESKIYCPDCHLQLQINDAIDQMEQELIEMKEGLFKKKTNKIKWVSELPSPIDV